MEPSLHVRVRGRGQADAARHIQLQAVQVGIVQARQLLGHALRQGIADARRQVAQRAQRVVRQPIALPAKPNPSIPIFNSEKVRLLHHGSR